MLIKSQQDIKPQVYFDKDDINDNKRIGLLDNWLVEAFQNYDVEGFLKWSLTRPSRFSSDIDKALD